MTRVVWAGRLVTRVADDRRLLEGGGSPVVELREPVGADGRFSFVIKGPRGGAYADYDEICLTRTELVELIKQLVDVLGEAERVRVGTGLPFPHVSPRQS